MKRKCSPLSSSDEYSLIIVITNKARIAEVNNTYDRNLGTMWKNSDLPNYYCDVFPGIMKIKSFEMTASAISLPLLPLGGGNAPLAFTRRH